MVRFRPIRVRVRVNHAGLRWYGLIRWCQVRVCKVRSCKNVKVNLGYVNDCDDKSVK